MKAKDQPFFVQKVHLEIGGFIIATGMFEVIQHIGRPNDGWRHERSCSGDPSDLQWGPFACWSLTTFVALFANISQSWLGGLVAKQLSSVVKAVAQCLSLLLIYFFGDLVLKGEQFDWPVGVMSIVVALSVTIFTLAGQGVKRLWKTEKEDSEQAEELAEETQEELAESPLLSPRASTDKP